ncbi:MAG: acyl-CoA synthetase [Pseudomonadota bacterium]
MARFAHIKTLQDTIDAEAVNWREHCQSKSTYDLIKSAASRAPDHPAIEFLPTGLPGETPIVTTYGELFSNITRAANAFHRNGLDSKDVLTYILPNLPETHEVIWGAEASGIVNALNPLLEAETMAALMRAVNSKIFVIARLPHQNDALQTLLSVADAVDSIKTVIIVDGLKYYDVAADPLPTVTPAGKPVLDYAKVRDAETSDRLVSGRDIKPEDIASIFHTGGTTGLPKLAPHTHENEVFTAFIIGNGSLAETTARYFVGLPLFHVNAVIGTGLGLFVSLGTAILATPAGYRSPNIIPNFWQLVEQHQPSYVSGVPTIYAALMDVPIGDADISSLSVAICGAAPLSPDLFKRFEAYSGVNIIEGYGLTEGTVLSTANPLKGERKIGSIGLRAPYQQVKCGSIDPETGKVTDCEPDEVGSILIKGPNLFPGYLGLKDYGFTADGWFDTGDLGRMDGDGYFWLTGRSKDIIIRGGHNIDPAIIENTIAEHPAVANVAAIGQPDAYSGEVPCAYVDLVEGADADSEEIRLWTRERITEKGAAPVYLEIMDALPVTAIGKISKPPLRRLATERVIEEALLENGIAAAIHVLDKGKGGFEVEIRTPHPENAKAALGGFTVPLAIHD